MNERMNDMAEWWGDPQSAFYVCITICASICMDVHMSVHMNMNGKMFLNM